MADFVGAVDQGTTSTRFMVFDHDGNEVGKHQLEHKQILPRAGWVEHNPIEIWERTQTVIGSALTQLRLQASDLVALGITNQRETTVVWDKRSGRPLYNAIVWQDTRTDRIAAALDRDGRGEVIRQRAGLPPATYFSAGKVQWILENVEGVREAAERGDALFGTTDSWLLWNLTGGTRGGVHVTDVTNASRTMLMDLQTLDWDEELLGFFDIPAPCCRRSVRRLTLRCTAGRRPRAPWAAVPLAGALGDQQAATVGQVCFSPGEAKNTYGTGNFMLLNTGEEMVHSSSGLLTTVAYQFGDAKPVYALEGSIAVTGSAVQWLRDHSASSPAPPRSSSSPRRSRTPAACTSSPRSRACSPPTGALTPAAHRRDVPLQHQRPPGAGHARGHLLPDPRRGRCHGEGLGVNLECLKVDGGVTANRLCMQLQSDILGVPVSKPEVAETTALGAAYAAGLATGFWKDTDELRANWHEAERWEPRWTDEQRAKGYAGWQKAVQRTLDWVDED